MGMVVSIPTEETSMHDQIGNLRPLESVILRLADEGMSSSEIGRRIGKKPGTVDRIHAMIDYKRDIPVQISSSGRRLNPLETVIGNLRRRGETYGEIGNRLGRSGAQIRRIEWLTEFRP